MRAADHISCTEVCYMEDKIEQKVCSLCQNKINIEKERQGAKECLEIQAMKMKLLPGESYSEASVGTTVRIPVPDNRGRGDTRSVLAVVMGNTGEGFFQLGSRDGRIKQLYSRSQFGICERELISIEEVPNIDTMLRSIATAESCGTGKGFKKCSCFKNNMQCNL
ncbi:KRAB-A domain-containing protein 2 [Nephila pilipes]|uniref:KRAB-A domain-containing protein 2 n=1 Tax=Nephila pilipes TaxID=299642 RepID=A0A8X6MTC8_NEPPI|nr:KRAB-A domain-containing protein 2 [Nephila pilipes]